MRASPGGRRFAFLGAALFKKPCARGDKTPADFLDGFELLAREQVVRRALRAADHFGDFSAAPNKVSGRCVDRRGFVQHFAELGKFSLSA